MSAEPMINDPIRLLNQIHMDLQSQNEKLGHISSVATLVGFVLVLMIIGWVCSFVYAFLM